MGGIMIHGLNPGFELFTRNQDILRTLFFGLIVANFLLLIAGTILSKYAAKVTVIPIYILAPTIVVLGVISTYVIRSQFLDVLAAVVAGVVGYYMKKYEYSTIPFLVAFILSPIAEKSFYQALLLAEGSYWTFALRPISGTLLLVTILVLVLPPILKKFKKNKEEFRTPTNDSSV
jgi:putative tricarboxylic transport membrane protein